jgi:hypothetical protein
MYNPYTILTPAILAAMLKQPMYFVRQHYPRGVPHVDEKIIPLLLTHYIHHETDKERAERHIRLLMKDPYRFLYNSKNPEHVEKLKTAASQPEGYRIYINLLPKKWKANDALKMKISRYVREKLPWWNYSPRDKLNVTLKERYGELFIALLWRGQQTEVLLDDIENFSVCATT